MSEQPISEEASSTAKPNRRFTTEQLFVAVFVLVMGVRLLSLAGAPDLGWPHSRLYEGDAPAWVTYAAALERGEEFEFGLMHRSPGVAHLLHWISPNPAKTIPAFKLLWSALSALTCAFAFLAFKREIDPRTAAVFALVCGASFSQYVLASALNVEVPYGLLLVLLVWGTGSFATRPSWILAAGLGLAHGAATLLRPEHPLVLLLFAGYMAWSMWRARSRGSDDRVVGPVPQLAMIAVTLLLAVGICIPWTISGNRAMERYNATPRGDADYAALPVVWSEDAVAFVDTLPSFSRTFCVQFISKVAADEGLFQLDAEAVRVKLLEEFDYIPEPLSTANFVSSVGPLNFALANLTSGDGGFNRDALDDRLGASRFMPRMPSHLKLYNRGYAAGLRFIREDPLGWLKLVVRKMHNLGDGIAQGYTARNLPLGMTGTRRAVDMFTADASRAWWWRLPLAALLVGGVVIAVRRRIGALWMLLIGAKLVTAVLFFGFARQSASILPAFLFFIGLAAAALLAAAGRRLGGTARRAPLLAALLLVGWFAIDLWTVVRPVRLQIIGPIRPASAWGSNAWESSQRLVIRPADADAHELSAPAGF